MLYCYIEVNVSVVNSYWVTHVYTNEMYVWMIDCGWMKKWIQPKTTDNNYFILFMQYKLKINIKKNKTSNTNSAIYQASIIHIIR